MDTALASIIVAGIAAFGAVASAWLTLRQRPKLDEVHHQVSTNHGESDPPTVLDRLDNLETKVETCIRAVADLRAVVGGGGRHR